jgi:pyruvate carboxylase
MSAALYPNVFDRFEQFRQKYGPVDKLSTRVFLVGLDTAEETDVCTRILVFRLKM